MEKIVELEKALGIAETILRREQYHKCTNCLTDPLLL